MGNKVGENPAALRAAVFLLSAKNRRGGGGGVFKHPPSRAKVKQVLAHLFAVDLMESYLLNDSA